METFKDREMHTIHKVIFRKIKNNHNRLRTDEIEGETEELPTEGKAFTMFGEGLEFGVRVINTSLAIKVEKSFNLYTFETASGSVYQVEYLYTTTKS